MTAIKRQANISPPHFSARRKSGRLLLIALVFVLASSSSTNACAPPDSSITLYVHDIKFEGSDVHIDGNYLYILETFVEYLEKNPSISVHIRGHVCCRAGQRISRRRARNVYRYLKRRGIEKSRMTHAGYSDTILLVSPERTSEDERVNRRVDFVLKEIPADRE